MGRLGRNSSAEAFASDVKGCACRYHMRYTRDMEREVKIGRP